MAIKKSDISRQKAAKELLHRRRAREHLLDFTTYTKKDYQVNWHHRLLCEKLDAMACGDLKRLIVSIPVRMGKQIADSTKVLTTEGWKTHGDLKVGDSVFSPSGKPVKIIAVSDKTPSDWVVTLSNGQQIRCHGDHEWEVFSRSRRKTLVVETRWFASKTKQGNCRKLTSSCEGERCQFQLPHCSPVEFSEKSLTIHPYVLGAWLGDGSRTKPCITHDKNDTAVIRKIESCGYEVSTVCVHNTTGVHTTYFSGPRPNVSGRMTLELNELGVMRNKFIPDVYLRGSVEQRLQLLAGLIDTDGCCDKKYGRISFSTVEKRLADDVVDLCTTLGFRPYVVVQQPRLSTSGIQGKKEVYVVGFNPTVDIPCALDRKRPKRLIKQYAVGIKSVEFLPNGEVGNCIQVDSADGLYLVGEKLVPTHNSELVSRRFPAYLLGRDPDMKVIATSYSADLASRMNRDVQRIIESPEYQALFPDTKLRSCAEAGSFTGKYAQNSDLFEIIDHEGVYRSAGVGGGITGMGGDCLTGDAELLTSSGLMKIERIVKLHRDGHHRKVLAYDHNAGKPVWKKIEAVRIIHNREVYSITTLCGGTISATPDHRIFVCDRGYVPIYEVHNGDAVLIHYNNDFQVSQDIVKSIKRCSDTATVYDIQVEDTQNFFANGLLVHNCLIIDDPFKSREEAESTTQRNKTYEWYTDVFRTRREKDASILITHTRWHEDDLVGRLLRLAEDNPEADQWETIVLPALSEEVRMPYDIRTGVDQSLWPEKFPETDLFVTKATSPTYTWLSLYQQRPSAAAGNIFKREDFRYFTDLGSMFLLQNGTDSGVAVQKNSCVLFQTCDPAGTIKTSSDNFVLSTWALTPQGDLLLLEVFKTKIEGADHVDFIKQQWFKWRPLVLGFESTGIGKTTYQNIRNLGINVYDLKPSSDKFTRALGAAIRLGSGTVYFNMGAHWLNDFEDELLHFPNVAHDDQVDTVSAADFMLSSCIIGNYSTTEASAESVTVGYNYPVQSASYSNEPRSIGFGW